jgi:periplasmic divalent cation tolerance protein
MNEIVVFVTFPSRSEAERIVHMLLTDTLIACGNVIDSVSSFFWWQGKIDSAPEVMVLMKTRGDLFDELAKKIKEHHSYEVPEIIALPILKGSQDYLDWIHDSVRG